jgi:hypothetical protein
MHLVSDSGNAAPLLFPWTMHRYPKASTWPVVDDEGSDGFPIIEYSGGSSSIYLREDVNRMHIMRPSGDPETQVPAYIRCSL